MATDSEPEVKDVDRVEITPAGADAEDVDDKTEDTEPDSSQEETEGDGEKEPEGDDSKKPDQLVTPKAPVTEPAQAVADTTGADGLAAVEGETPKERALRAELKRTRDKLRKEQGDDLLGGERPPQGQSTPQLSQEDSAIIGKYKTDEVAALREIVPVLAKEMGFVRKDELQGTAYAERSQESLDHFLEKHPEYLPENDTDGTLWNAFKSEFGLYKTPTNPKDYTKIFERIHRDVFGIKPKGPLSTVTAQQEKTRVASHAGASSAPAAPRSKPATNPAGLRLDMLKGFSDEDIAEITSGTE